MGDMSQRRETVIGPFSVFLNTTEIDSATGTLVTEDHEDETTGKITRRIKKETTPFLTKVYYKKNVMNANLQRELRDLNSQTEMAGLTLTVGIKELSKILHSWDLTDGGKAVPPTEQGMLDANLDPELLFAVTNRFYEAIQPPKQ